MKAQEKVTKLQCSACKRINYYTQKNKKVVERKLEFKKFCKWCRQHMVHKEGKKQGAQFSGKTAVSKTADGGSIPSAPAKYNEQRSGVKYDNFEL